jgi:hypothetical protein
VQFHRTRASACQLHYPPVENHVSPIQLNGETIPANVRGIKLLFFE